MASAAQSESGAYHGVWNQLSLIHEVLDLGVALQQGGHGLRALQAPALQDEGRVRPFALQTGPGAVSGLHGLPG